MLKKGYNARLYYFFKICVHEFYFQLDNSLIENVEK